MRFKDAWGSVLTILYIILFVLVARNRGVMLENRRIGIERFDQIDKAIARLQLNQAPPRPR